MRILHALLALATFSLPFSYALTVNVGFPLKIYELCLLLAAPLFFFLGQGGFSLKYWRFLLAFLLFTVAILFTVFYRADHPAMGFDPEDSESRFGPFLDSVLKIGYAGFNFLGFFLFGWYAKEAPQQFLKCWIAGAVVSAAYSIYAASFSALHWPVVILPGVAVVQYYNEHIIRNGTFLEGNYSGLFYLISWVLAVREKKWGAVWVLGLGVLSSLSTTSIFMLLMTGVVLLAYQLRHIRAVVIWGILVNLFLVTGLILVSVGSTKFGDAMIRKLTETQPGLSQSDVSFSRDNRLDTAISGLRMFAHQPLLGVGLAQYTNYYLHYTKFPLTSWTPQRVIANNVYAEILGETGLAGGLPFFAILFMIGKFIWTSKDFYFVVVLGEILFGWNAFPTFSIMYIWAFFGGALGLLSQQHPSLGQISPARAQRGASFYRSRRRAYFYRSWASREKRLWGRSWKKWLFWSMVVIALATSSYYLFSLQDSPVPPPKNFILGITGQAPEQEIYEEIPPEEQMKLVRELGMDWYRVAWSDQSTPEQIDRILSAAAAAQVKILPVLTPRIDLTLDRPLEDYEREAEQFARKWVGRYGNRLSTWELHNELDVEAILKKGDWNEASGQNWSSGSPDGSKLTDYESHRLARALAVLRGLSLGVAAVEPQAVRLIGTAGWKHYGFLQAVEEAGIPYEIISWHWYSEMGTMTDAGGTNVLEELRSFHRDIWITESGRRDGSLFQHEADQAEYYRQDFHRMVSYYPQVKAYFVYELLDEPAHGVTDGESYYGLLKVDRKSTGSWQVIEHKPAFQVIQNGVNWVRGNDAYR